MFNEVVAQFPYALYYVPDYLKTKKVCDDAVDKNPEVFFLVPDRFKTKDMRIKALEVDPWSSYDIPDNLKTEGMCNKAVENDRSSLQYVPDCFVIQLQLDIWFDDNYWYHDDDMIEWYKGYKKRMDEKANIKEELLPIAWHPDHVMDWCVSEDEKKETEKLWR